MPAAAPGRDLIADQLVRFCDELREEGLAKEGSFKAAEARYTAVDQIDTERLGRWLAEAREVQWDYKNLVRRRGRLERLK